ncbi:hypothetical protein ACHAWF_010023 [Thalassiosira exigua]
MKLQILAAAALALLAAVPGAFSEEPNAAVAKPGQGLDLLFEDSPVKSADSEVPDYPEDEGELADEDEEEEEEEEEEVSVVAGKSGRRRRSRRRRRRRRSRRRRRRRRRSWSRGNDDDDFVRWWRRGGRRGKSWKVTAGDEYETE